MKSPGSLRGPARASVAVMLLCATARPIPLAAQTQRYTLAGDRVGIFNLVGRCSVEAGSGAEVVVEVTRRGADAEQLKVETGPIGRRQTLRVIYPSDRIIVPTMGRGGQTDMRVNDDGTFNDNDHGGRRVTIKGSGDGLEAHADLRILVPAGKKVAIFLGEGPAQIKDVNADISVSTASGDVSAQSVRGALGIDTGSGNVTVTGVEGNLHIDTGSGDVRIERAHGDELNIDTGSGNVTGVTMGGANLHIDTGSGDVRISEVEAGGASVETGSGEVHAAFLGELKSLKVETGSGDVAVTVPDKFAGEVDIDTSSGDDIEIGFPIQLIRKTDEGFRGKIGDGSGTISIETGSGGVTLSR